MTGRCGARPSAPRPAQGASGRARLWAVRRYRRTIASKAASSTGRPSRKSSIWS
ncbi:DNA-binding protein [Streptomyces noursei ZPM]|nr:DNA-binding protein [Streptomyces noursei ZPM]